MANKLSRPINEGASSQEPGGERIRSSLCLLLLHSTAPEITLGDISPDLFRSSAALPPDTLLLEFGSAWQGGGGGWRGISSSKLLSDRDSREVGRSVRKRRGQSPHLKADPVPRRLRLQQQMCVRVHGVGWSRDTRHHGLMITA
ncbi:hypothetical protein NQZ68_030898 [Dissostichus eleginoides]|nr:hypothetical protein NQZ68_030898 [Dissostichus eleginoides]